MAVAEESEKLTPERPPVCSVCIANYNGRDVIDACINSVINQDCGYPFEIIIHDDASTDESADYIAAHYPQLKLIRSDRNVGYCISNNRMAAQAWGRYLLLLNNDATLYPDALRALHTKATRESGPVILTLPQYNAETGTLVDRGLRLDPFLNPVPNLDPTRTEVSSVHGACLWVPSGLWHEIGGFPEWFHMLAEDLYLCCEARLRGAKVMVTPRSGYRHRIGYSIGGGKVQGTHLATTFRRRALSERNKTFVMTICYPSPILWLMLPLHMLLLLTEGLLLSAIRLDSRILSGIYIFALRGVFAHRRQLREHRRAVQRRRTITRLAFFETFNPLPHKLIMLWRYGLPRIRESP